MSEPARRYARVADGFGRRVEAVGPGSWDAPAPCQGWVARDVVRHLTEWIPGFFSSQAGLDAPPVPSVDDDPVAAWEGLDDVIRSWFADPAIGEESFVGPMGPTTVAAAIDELVTPDVLVHTWDLARAAGLDDGLLTDEVEGMVEAMEPYDAQLRASGHYGPRVDVADGVSTQDRLVAFLGRDPAWRPPEV